MRCPWCKDKSVAIMTPLGLRKHIERYHPDVSEKAHNCALEVLKRELLGEFKHFRRALRKYSL